MPEDIEDFTSSFDAPWYIDVNPYASVKKALKGTFCFAFGRGFGCGEKYEHSSAEEISLTANLSVQISGVTGGIGIGTKHTQADKWSYTSTKCEYCRPRICFPDSQCVIYEFRQQVLFVPLPLTTTAIEFNPGPQGNIERNCTQNDPICKCSGDSQAAFDSGGGGTDSDPALYSVMLQPTSWGMTLDDIPAEGAAEVAATYSAMLKETFDTFANRSGARPQIGVQHVDGQVTWLTGINYGPDIVPLSVNAVDFSPAGQPTALTGRYCTAAFAVTCGQKFEATASLLLAYPGGESQTFDGMVAREDGRTIVLATIIDTGGALPVGTRGALRIDLRDPDEGCAVAGITQNFIVPKTGLLEH